MQQLIWLIKQYFKTAFSKKSRILTYVLFPLASILLVLALYSMESGDTEPPKYGVIYDEQTVYGEKAIELMGKEGQAITVFETKKEAEDALTEEKQAAVIIFEKGFNQAVDQGETKHVQIISLKGDVVNNTVKRALEPKINHLIRLLDLSDGNQATFEKVLADYEENAFPVNVTKVSSTEKTGKILGATMLGVLSFFLLTSAGNMSDFMAKEKEEKTYYRLLSTPIKNSTYVLSKIVASFLLLEGQIILTLLMMKFGASIDPGVSYLFLFFMLSLFGLVSVSLVLVIFTYSSSYRVMTSMKTMIFTGSSMLAGMFVPLSLMPDFMQKIAHIFPQFWLIDGIKKIQENGDFSEILLNIGILLAFSILLFSLATYRQGKGGQKQSFV
ncbi:ABC transporter permease [Isobaculum melis]|uniref:ABC-2 type transport system permease protein n=1 Tax=Isobaculum melis TaxID=142588 RepID=A0A1H9QQZ2_9LACT|nr:ABC transporter permease [Isobaculum melis]SER62868.1 ABC-2 type transport system permease protein [Isobaculum melis]